MYAMDVLDQFGNVPVDYSVLRSVFSDYKVPRNKVFRLEEEGKLIRLKKGMYVVSPDVSGQLLSVELIANHLYGPSYVSMESALRHYGLIPEQVHTVRSMTTNRSKEFKNQIGTFQYVAVSEDYYPIGIRQETTDNTFLIASPEKALCDMIASTQGLYLQSVKAVAAYLEDGLRFDVAALQSMDVSIIGQCAVTGKKKKALKLLLKLIRR